MFDESTKQLGLLTAVGAAVGLGQLLASKETLTFRVVVGRAVASGGLGLAAGAALSFLPHLPIVALVGISATLASLGTSALEKLLQRFTGGA